MGQTTCQTSLYNQGDYSGRTIFQLICTNVPLGTIVSFTSDNPNTVPPITLMPTPVSNYPTFIAGMASEVPAGYTCTLNYCFTLLPGVVPPPGFSITMEAHIPIGENRYAVTKIG